MSDIEQLKTKVSELEAKIENLYERLTLTEHTTAKTLSTVIKAEQLNELNATMVLKKSFESVLFAINRSLNDMREHVKATNRDYKIEVVDGVNERQQDSTIFVTKESEGYSYHKAENPDNKITKGLDTFDEYFNNHPELFNESATIAVNIYQGVPSE